MPFDLFERDFSPTVKVILAIVALAAAWIAFQSGVLQALLALGVTSPTVLGLGILALIGYWAIDELEDDDDASDVIGKTADRAEGASKGFLDGAAALVMGVAAIVATVGVQAIDGLTALLDLAMTAPLAAANIGTLFAVGASAMGYLTNPMVVGVGIVLLVAGLIAHRRGATA